MYICIFSLNVHLTARKRVWFNAPVVEVMFVLFPSCVVVNHVAVDTTRVVTRLFLIGYVINKHWIVCIVEEHDTGT